MNFKDFINESYITGFTLRKALQKQAEQLEWYLKDKPYESTIRSAIALKTNVNGYNLDSELPVRIINQCVPRGASIEWEIENYLKNN